MRSTKDSARRHRIADNESDFKVGNRTLQCYGFVTCGKPYSTGSMIYENNSEMECGPIA
jgi:hypothetical protein